MPMRRKKYAAIDLNCILLTGFGQRADDDEVEHWAWFQEMASLDAAVHGVDSGVGSSPDSRKPRHAVPAFQCLWV